MAENRAQNFIERLPAIIEREEEDISHLDPEMIAILYPARASKELTLSLVFGPPPSTSTSTPDGDSDAARREALERSYQRAVQIAEGSRGYRVDGRGRARRHSAIYGLDEVGKLHEIFSLVGDFPTCEILVKGKRVPYARELWLPFFWFFKKDDA
jgi:hypothetical protein